MNTNVRADRREQPFEIRDSGLKKAVSDVYGLRARR